jgi:hypothetical protein
MAIFANPGTLNPSLMFNLNPYQFLSSQNIPYDSDLVHQLKVDLLYREFPILRVLWENYKLMSMSYLSDDLVSDMTNHVMRSIELSKDLSFFSRNISSCPHHNLNHYRQFEASGVTSSVLKHHIASWDSSIYWLSLGRCFRLVNPKFRTAAGEYVSYPLYYHDKSVLSEYDASSLEVRGNFFYPPGGFREWHTNSINPGWRAYCVFSDEAKTSSFNYLSPGNNTLSIVADKSDYVNLFRVGSYEEPELWHSVQSSTWRLSMGFRFNIQIHPDEMIPYINERLLDNRYSFNHIEEWEWWIRLPLWCAKSAVVTFLRSIKAGDSPRAISLLEQQIRSHNEMSSSDALINNLHTEALTNCTKEICRLCALGAVDSP